MVEALSCQAKYTRMPHSIRRGLTRNKFHISEISKKKKMKRRHQSSLYTLWKNVNHQMVTDIKVSIPTRVDSFEEAVPTDDKAISSFLSYKPGSMPHNTSDSDSKICALL